MSSRKHSTEPIDLPAADLDGDCSVGILDMLTLLGNWG